MRETAAGLKFFEEVCTHYSQILVTRGAKLNKPKSVKLSIFWQLLYTSETFATKISNIGFKLLIDLTAK